MTKPPAGSIPDPEYAAALIAAVCFEHKGWTTHTIAHELGINRRKLVELIGRRTRLRFPLQVHLESLLQPERVARLRADYRDRNRKRPTFWSHYF